MAKTKGLASFMVVLMIGVSILSNIGCSEETTTTTPTNTTTPTTQPTASPVESVGNQVIEDFKVTLDHIDWIDEHASLGEASWDSNLFWLVASFTVKNESPAQKFINYDDIYLITEQGKVYENSEVLYGIGPIAYEDFKPGEMRSFACKWYVSLYNPDGHKWLSELRWETGIKLVVGGVEFKMPQLANVELISQQQYRDRYGEDPPPLTK